MFIDSSAIVRFFAKEPNWENLESLVSKSYTLQIALDELGNALSKKIRSAEMQLTDAIEIIRSYQATGAIIDSSGYRETAIKISTRHNIPFYDSLFISAALVDNTVLITCDTRQAEVAKSLGITVELMK